MKVVILAGGFGTRLAEESDRRPKPMVEIGGRPILWHIMKHFAHFGHREFVLALGYKGEMIKRYFLDYDRMQSGLTVNLGTGAVTVRRRSSENWIVHMEDTGLDAQTGERIRRLRPLLDGEPFMVAYGDGVADVDVDALLTQHRTYGRVATVTAVRPPARFGGLSLNGNRVIDFEEKPSIGEGWINGGFLVFEPTVFDYLEGADNPSLELHALERIAADGQLTVHRHERYWQCMDTLRDVRLLEGQWQRGAPAWKVWKD